MSLISSMDETGFGHDWLCARIFSDRLEVKCPDPVLWEKKLTGQPGIHQVRACSESGRLEVTFDLRYHNRKKLSHRICGPAA